MATTIFMKTAPQEVKAHHIDARDFLNAPQTIHKLTLHVFGALFEGSFLLTELIQLVFNKLVRQFIGLFSNIVWLM